MLTRNYRRIIRSKFPHHVINHQENVIKAGDDICNFIQVEQDDAGTVKVLVRVFDALDNELLDHLHTERDFPVTFDHSLRDGRTARIPVYEAGANYMLDYYYMQFILRPDAHSALLVEYLCDVVQRARVST